MSGGDLDGDVYMAIWEKSIIDQLDDSKMAEPARYSKAYVPKVDRLPTSENIADYIAYYF